MHQMSFALCSVVDRPVRLALCQVDLSEDGTPPEWIMLVPAGDEVKALDGRKFSNAKPEAVVDAFNADPRDVPIDWEHATEVRAPFGEDAPAAGWIKALEVRAGAIWARVEWTPRGEEMLRKKEYRYISPAFIFETIKKGVKLVSEIISAGLTNRPALDMPAIARTKTGTARTEDTMDREKLIKKFGLDADATDEDIYAAIDALQALKAKGAGDDVKEVKAELETTRTELATTKTELANARNANPSLDHFVPRADHDAALARAKALEDEKAEIEKASHAAAVETAITAALKSGKITPATKDFYVDTCSTKEGLDKFNKFVEGAPKIAEPSDLDNKPTPDPTVVNDEAFAAASSFTDMTKEEFAKAQAEVRAANTGQL